MIAQTQDYTDTIDAHGILVEVPSRYAPEEETESEPVYQPAPTCGQCEHFYQSKHPKAVDSPWGYCPVLDAERRMSDQPCRLYTEDCPF